MIDLEINNDDYIIITWREHPKVVDNPVYADIHEIIINKKDNYVTYTIIGPTGCIKKRISGNNIDFI